MTYIHSKRNLNILKHNINQLLVDPRIEIIVVEAGKNSMLKDLDLKCKYVFTQTDTFNVGWLFNIGARRATTNKLFFAESSIFPKMEFITSIVRKPTEHECIYGQSDIIELDAQATDSKKYNYDMPSKQDTLSGLHYYTYEGFYKVGTWDENLYGKDLYSFQDKKNVLLLKLGKVDNTKIIKFTLDVPSVDEEQQEASTKHYDKVTSVDQDKIMSYIRSQVKKSSNIHKYEKVEIMKP
jgi:hypothetical protein